MPSASIISGIFAHSSSVNSIFSAYSPLPSPQPIAAQSAFAIAAFTAIMSSSVGSSLIGVNTASCTAAATIGYILFGQTTFTSPAPDAIHAFAAIIAAPAIPYEPQISSTLP